MKRCCEKSTRGFRCELDDGHEDNHQARGLGKVFRWVVITKQHRATTPDARAVRAEEH